MNVIIRLEDVKKIYSIFFGKKSQCFGAPASLSRNKVHIQTYVINNVANQYIFSGYVVLKLCHKVQQTGNILGHNGVVPPLRRLIM